MLEQHSQGGGQQQWPRSDHGWLAAADVSVCFSSFFGHSYPPGGGGELWKLIWPLPSLPFFLLLLQAVSWAELMFECKTFWGCLCLVQLPQGWPWALPAVVLLPRGLWGGCTGGTPSLSPGCDLEPEPWPAQQWCYSQALLVCKTSCSLVNKCFFCSHSSGTKLSVSPGRG